MKNNPPNENKRKWVYNPYTDRTLNALGAVLDTWVATENYIEDDASSEAQKVKDFIKEKGIQYSDDEIHEYFFELDQARLEHDQVYKPMQRYSCVAMLFSTVEHELLSLRKNLDKENEKRSPARDFKVGKNENQIYKAKKYLSEFENIDFEKCPQYALLHDLMLIRNCIMHCLGNVSAMVKDEDRERLYVMGQCVKGFTAYSGSQIRIEPELIMHLMEEIWELFQWVFIKLGWTPSPIYHNKLRFDRAKEMMANIRY